MIKNKQASKRTYPQTNKQAREQTNWPNQLSQERLYMVLRFPRVKPVSSNDRVCWECTSWAGSRRQRAPWEWHEAFDPSTPTPTWAYSHYPFLNSPSSSGSSTLTDKPLRATVIHTTRARGHGLRDETLTQEQSMRILCLSWNDGLVFAQGTQCGSVFQV